MFPDNKPPLAKMLGLNNGVEDGKDEGPGAALSETAMESKGCTANVAYIKDGKIYCANAGDSRCVLSINGVAK